MKNQNNQATSQQSELQEEIKNFFTNFSKGELNKSLTEMLILSLSSEYSTQQERESIVFTYRRTTELIEKLESFNC